MKDRGQTINKVIGKKMRAGAQTEWERVIQGCRRRCAGVEI